MTKQDRQKLSILIVLLAVLGLTMVLGYRMVRPPSAASVQPAEAKTSANPPAPGDANIRLDLLEAGAGDGDVGNRNVFQYRQAPLPPPPPPRGGASGAATQPPITTGQRPQTVQPGPPQPPPIPFKYQGFAVTSPPDGGFTAFLSDDVRHFNVKTGEVLMGRFRIVSISEKTVEIEDLEHNRRQMLPLLK